MDQRSEEEVKRLFTYEEAAALLPEVQRITAVAVDEVEHLGESEEMLEQYQTIVGRWAEEILRLGIEVKGLWLIDFDSGSGYYCWQWPEPGLQFFHGYEDGFRGRVQLN
jgi:hypothetical protein